MNRNPVNHRAPRRLAWAPIALAPLLLAACATTPTGPTVLVLPAANKPFEVFQQEQDSCKQYAQSQVAGQAEASNQNAVGSAALGTLLGAGLGAAIGNHQGAAVGAAAGAIVGSSAGGRAQAYGQGSIQGQYNNAFVQCMVAKGNPLAGNARVAQAAPAPGVVYVTPAYASPGPGWVWMFNAGYGWGWHHPVYGWHQGWR
jgi:hypothetical protein